MRATAWAGVTVMVLAALALTYPASGQAGEGTLHFQDEVLQTIDGAGLGCTAERYYGMLPFGAPANETKAYVTQSTVGGTCATHFTYNATSGFTVVGPVGAFLRVSCDLPTVFRGGGGQLGTVSVRILLDGEQVSSGGTDIVVPDVCTGSSDVFEFDIEVPLEEDLDVPAGSVLGTSVLIWVQSTSGESTLDNVHLLVGGANGSHISAVGIPVPVPPTGGVPGDSDADGLNDTWEQDHFGDLNQTGDGDPDSDGRSNAQEFAAGTDPSNADTDGDGLNDGEEASAGTDPKNEDTDGDGFSDKEEVDAGSDPLDADSVPEGGTTTTTTTTGTTTATTTGTTTGTTTDPNNGGQEESQSFSEKISDNTDYLLFAGVGALVLIILCIVGLRRWAL